MSKRSPFVVRLARPYVRRRIRRAFDGLFVEGLEAVAELANTGPVIVAANHVCWWDALTILALDAELGVESHCLMDRENMATMPFFGWVGAVPLDRSSPRGALRDMKASLDYVDRPGRSLWIFPQGRQRPAHLRPLELHAGVHWLARKSRATVVPLSLSYLYREAPQPTIVATFGAPIGEPGRDAESWLTNLERALIRGLDRCDRFVVSGAGAFTALVAPQTGARVPVAGRLLAAAFGGAHERKQAHG